MCHSSEFTLPEVFGSHLVLKKEQAVGRYDAELKAFASARSYATKSALQPKETVSNPLARRADPKKAEGRFLFLDPDIWT
jgi:hypothetical protein